MQNHLEELENINKILEENMDLTLVFNQLDQLYPGKVIFSTSFSEEDQIVHHLICAGSNNIQLFTLDTGRLFPETYSTWSRTLEKYGRQITPYYPNTSKIEEFVQSKGPNSFYESIENRKACCFIRKVEPLKRALAHQKIWITGIRAEHSPDRSHMPQVEWDETHQVIKIHPILHWNNEEVKSFIKNHEVPYNPLHEKGFVSIGCAPCTRAIQPGEDFRAGRWWWEDKEKKECGLHTHQ